MSHAPPLSFPAMWEIDKHFHRPVLAAAENLVGGLYLLDWKVVCYEWLKVDEPIVDPPDGKLIVLLRTRIDAGEEGLFFAEHIL